MRKKRVKLADIAQKLGVSVGLVSVVLSGKWKASRISEPLAKRVVETAKEMGYQKNQLAISLRTGKSNIIGLIVADIGNPFFGRMARYVEDEVTKRGYQLMIGSSDEDSEKFNRIIDVFLSRQLDGLLVVPVQESASKISNAIVDDYPLVFIDRYCEAYENDAVLSNNFEGAYQLCQILVNKGYKKIAAFVYNSSLTNNKERINGYKEALKNANIKEGAEGEFVFELDFKNLEESLKSALKSAISQGCDSIFFANNQIGALSLTYLRDMNVEIPKQLGVVGFDNPQVYEIIEPGITCFEQPIEEICKKAVDILFQKINGDTKQEKHKILLPGKILTRHSC